MADSKDDVLKAQEQLKKVNGLIDDLKKIGVEVPELTKAANRLQIAIDTGADLGNAAAETSAALAAHANEAYKACGDDAVCQAKYDRLYQARAVNFTLSPGNKESVLNNFIRATFQRHLPQVICDKLDSCRHKDGGQK